MANNLKPHLYKSALQSEKSAGNKQEDVAKEAAVVKETVSENNMENCADIKENENSLKEMKNTLIQYIAEKEKFYQKIRHNRNRGQK